MNPEFPPILSNPVAIVHAGYMRASILTALRSGKLLGTLLFGQLLGTQKDSGLWPSRIMPSFIYCDIHQGLRQLRQPFSLILPV